MMGVQDGHRMMGVQDGQFRLWSCIVRRACCQLYRRFRAENLSTRSR